MDKTLRAFPEIADVVTKIGRPDFATEAMGINEGDVYVLLRPRKEWKRFQSKEELIQRMDEALAQIPGIAYNFTQPMAMRMDETVSGVKVLHSKAKRPAQLYRNQITLRNETQVGPRE